MEITNYTLQTELYQAFSRVDANEYCLHHLFNLCDQLQQIGVCWMPDNCAKAFTAFAACVLGQYVFITGNSHRSTECNSGVMCEIKTGELNRFWEITNAPGQLSALPMEIAI